MAISLSKNLKLRVDSNLTANAKYNLYKIDELGAVYQVDNTGDVRVRAKTDIVLQPEDSSVGGSGTGGSVTIGSEAAPIDTFTVWADTVEFSNGLALQDIAEPGTGSRLYLEYDSSIDGNPASGSDYALTLDTQSADRQLVLGTDVAITGPGSVTFTAAADVNLALPASGALVTTTATQSLTNKTIDGSLNTLSNIPGSAIVPNGAIPYAALNLANSIANGDVNATAGIDYTKLNLSNGIRNADINASAAIQYSKLALANGIKDSDVSTSAAISYSKLALLGSIVNSDVATNAAIARSKLAAGSANYVLVNDGSGQLSEAPVLGTQQGGTGVQGTATYPVTGVLVTADNGLTLTNKSLSGASNTFSNIPYSALLLSGSIKNADVASDAAILYSKLNLAGSITDSDIAVTADISGAKIIPDFLDQEIRTSGGLRLDGNTYSTRIYAAPGNSQAAELSLYLPDSYGTAGYVMVTDGNGQLSWAQVTGTGTVTSVALQAPTDVFTVSGSPITTAGTLTLDFNDQGAKTVFAGPTAGADTAPSFRLLQMADLPALTAARAVVTNSSGVLTASAVTDTELGYVGGVTSAIQTQLDGKQPIDGDLTALSALTGTGFSARTASDTWALRSLTQGTGISITNPAGVAGNPTITNTAPDQTVVLTDGAGILVTGTYPNFTIASTITQYTDELAQDAVGNILVDTADIDFTYSDATPSIAAVLTTTGVSAASHGSATSVATFTVDTKGRLTAAGDTTIAIPSTQVTDFTEAAQDAVGTALTDSTSIDFTYDDVGNTITAVVAPGTMTTKATPVSADLIVIGDSAASNAVKTITISALSAAITPQSFKADWLTADGTTKVVTHNLGSLDVMVQLYDTTVGDTILVDSIVRTDANTLTLTSSQAPASSWRILITKV